MIQNAILTTLAALALAGVVAARAEAAYPGETEFVQRVKPGTNKHYTSQRAPLLPTPFMKLDVGSIKPKGWLRKQLELEADGFIGNLGEISEFLKKPGNAWLSKTGEGDHGWEEVPYWLKGYGDLGYVLGDKRIVDEARVWIEAALASQRDDGFFGPRAALTSLNGKPDLWAHMVMLNALQTYYEYCGDKRVIKLMTEYFRWQNTIPEGDLLNGYWPVIRGGDNLASIYWLYNRTGDAWLLELAEKMHRHTADWTAGVANEHGVNFAQAFREPATYYLQAQDKKFKDATYRDYDEFRGIYGQAPGGLYGADENARPGYIDPRQAAETCTMVEMMLSCEMLYTSLGDPLWADRCEDVALNSLPASMTADLKALRYLTAANHAISDSGNKAPGIQNGGPMFHFDPNKHRCCQHNVSHGWPYYAENLWQATAGNGLVATFYAPCEVTAKAGSATYTISEETSYPFDETVKLTFKTDAPSVFPLYLRVPSWCKNPDITLNGQKFAFKAKSGGFIKIERAWTSRDVLLLRLPMSVQLTRWAKNKDSVSVNRGPLTYSLKIGERMARNGGTDKWQAWDLLPTTPYNYGLVLAEKKPEAGFQVVKRGIPANGQPFQWDAAPIELTAKARRIPAWKVDYQGLLNTLQPSPAKTNEPIETITLVPMGCARLRIASFPTVGDGPDAHEWVSPKDPMPASASWVGYGDTVAGLSDGLLPASSGDVSIPRFTWWEHKGTSEWVQYDFESPREVSEVGVYWFDDSKAGGGCRVPASWRLEALIDGAWHEVRGATACGVEPDKLNVVTFPKQRVSKLRIVAQLQPEASAGILEWVVK